MSEEMKDWIVIVGISRIQRRVIEVAVTATSKTVAEAEGRAQARQMMDRDTLMPVIHDTSLPWSLDVSSGVEVLPAGPS